MKKETRFLDVIVYSCQMPESWKRAIKNWEEFRFEGHLVVLSNLDNKHGIVLCYFCLDQLCININVITI
jgi:hypothetical protein